MVIGVLRLEFWLHDNFSLKGKRRVANSLRHKLRAKFNVAVSEIEAQDDTARLVLAIVGVGPDQRAVEGRMQKALNMVEAAADEDIGSIDLEFFSPY
jgi:hypothetical protein